MHPGIKKMIKTIAEYTKISGLKYRVTQIISKCRICNTVKDFRHNYGIPVHEIKISKPIEAVGLDIKGPIKRSHFNLSRKKGYFYILVITDLFSR